jgi:hypothetical protein
MVLPVTMLPICRVSVLLWRSTVVLLEKNPLLLLVEPMSVLFLTWAAPMSMAPVAMRMA